MRKTDQGGADVLHIQQAYFEDLQVGQEVKTLGRTITEADVVAFSALSGDYHSLHTDAVQAAQGPYGQRIAHGLLNLAVTSGLILRLGVLEDALVAFRELSCKFSRPVFIGDTVHARVKVTERKAMRRLGGGLVHFDIKLYNQHEQVVQSGVWKVLVRSRKADTENGRV